MPPQTLCKTACKERGIKTRTGMPKAPLTVCVVGGGFTGAAVAVACLAHLKFPFRLVMRAQARLGAVLPMAVIIRSICSTCARAIFRSAPASPAIF
jgi:hypothetical protein